MLNNTEKTMEKIVALCKNRGFIFAGSDIYGGLANTWDYGPLGARMKNNVKDTWRKRFIQERRNSYEVDADILMHPKVWEASGHIASFSDPLLDCKECKMRHRADTLIENFDPDAHPDKMTKEEMFEYIKAHSIPCPHCGKHNFTDIREFNLMFQTYRGVTNDAKSVIYLRPENAQGEYVNFLNVQRSMRAKLPFSIGQIGKAFRNEITPGNFTFRTIEFEQMEFQTFCKKGSDNELYDYFKQFGKKYFEDLGIAPEHLRFHDHEKLAHYANAATDIEFHMPFGFKEVEGIHSRTDFDLSQHEKFSGRSIKYFDPDTNESYTPYDIETSIGVDRMFLTILCHSYTEEKLDNGSERIVLRLPEPLAPVKCAVLPLVNKDGLPEKAQEIVDSLKFHFNTHYDEKDTIGKRYRRQDAIGTPYCVTVDYDTLKDNTVTLRFRDTMEQERVSIDQLQAIIEDKVSITSLLKKLQ